MAEAKSGGSAVWKVIGTVVGVAATAVVGAWAVEAYQNWRRPKGKSAEIPLQIQGETVICSCAKASPASDPAPVEPAPVSGWRYRA